MELTKELLEELYINQNKTVDELSQYFGMHKRQLYRTLKSFDISKRKNNPQQVALGNRTDFIDNKSCKLIYEENRICLYTIKDNKLAQYLTYNNENIEYFKNIYVVGGLNKLILYTKKKYKPNHLYIKHVDDEDIILFEKLLFKKQDDGSYIWNKYNGGEFQLPYDVLYDLFITQNKTEGEIAEIYKVSRKVIHTRLQKNNIVKSSKLKVEKRKQTNLLKYGVELPPQSDVFKEKTKQTNIDRYGKPYTSQVEQFKEAAKQTNLKKYGVDSPFKSPEIKRRAVETIINKYGVYNTKYLGKPKEVVDALTSREGMLKYLDENNIETIGTVSLANRLGVSQGVIRKIANKYSLTDRIIISKHRSHYEDMIVDILHRIGIPDSEIELNAKVINNPNSSRPSDTYELDIYLPKYHLGIEYNGSAFHNEKYKEYNYHEQKETEARKQGIFIFNIFGYTVSDEEVELSDDEIEIARAKIEDRLRVLTDHIEHKIPARKCKIVDLSDDKYNDVKRRFMIFNHLQGFVGTKYTFGLTYDDELVEIMTFDTNEKYAYELTRNCSLRNTIVVGGASKLFQHFVRNYMKHGDKIISFSDNGTTKGIMYKNLGFVPMHQVNPRYVWRKHHEPIISRRKAQKICKGVAGSEAKIMQSLGYTRIYDCGKTARVYTK